MDWLDWTLIACGIAASTGLYAMALHRIHDRYTPDYVWLTVVIGNAILGFWFLGFCIAGLLPMLAFWVLLLVCVAGGSSIILWQLAQMYERHQERTRWRN